MGRYSPSEVELRRRILNLQADIRRKESPTPWDARMPCDHGRQDDADDLALKRDELESLRRQLDRKR